MARPRTLAAGSAASDAVPAPAIYLPPAPAPGRRALDRAQRALTVLGALAALVLGGLTLGPALLGLRHYVVVGGSMTPAIPRGSIVFDRVVPVAALRVGDVISYTPPAVTGRGLLTHRIVWIGHDRFGARVFQTKGDANAARDPWRFGLPHPTQARVTFHVPFVGYAFGLLSLRWARMLLLGLPAALIGLRALSELGSGLRRRRTEAAA